MKPDKKDKKDKKGRPIDFVIILAVLGITVAPVIAVVYLKTIQPEATSGLEDDFGVIAPIALTGLIGFMGGRAVGKMEKQNGED